MVCENGKQETISHSIRKHRLEYTLERRTIEPNDQSFAVVDNTVHFRFNAKNGQIDILDNDLAGWLCG